MPGKSHGQRSLATVHRVKRVRHDLVTKQQSVDVKIGGVSQINQESPVSAQKWKRAAGVSYAAGFEDEE